MSTSTGSSELVHAMGPVARELLGDPTEEDKAKRQLRFGNRGSMAVDLAKGTWHDHEAGKGGGVLDLVREQRSLDKAGAVEWLREHGHLPKTNGSGSGRRQVTAYDYTTVEGDLVFQVVRYEPKDFRQRRPDGKGDWLWKMAGVQRVIYALPKVAEAIKARATVFVVEGEKAADRLAGLGLAATCSPAGANKWKAEHSAFLVGADVVILPDNDEPGRSHAAMVATSLRGKAASVRVLSLPGLPDKGDVADWLANGGTADALMTLVGGVPDGPAAAHTDAAPPPLKAKVNRDKAGAITSLDGEDLTEDGIALAFTKAHQDQLRYDHTRAAWFQWTGKAWRQDQIKLAFSWCRRTCRQLAKEAGVEDGDLARLARAATAAAVERFAQSDEAFAVTSTIWDADPFLMGTPGGTLDLRTGEIREAIPEDHITKLAAIAPARSPDCPRWLAFLEQVTNGDHALIRFLRQWCGYCLTGDTREHALLFAHGDGGNGKGVFLNVLAWTMGDYARNAAMDTFTASQSDRHPTDLAMLRGARLVTASETEEGRAWAEARIKALTGGDTITARFMRQDFFEFRPEFKLTIIGNHKPILRNVDEAARRRINLAPFLYKPPQQDKQLEAKLREEGPGILRWMVEGCLDWQMNGLVRPDVVLSATADYFSEQDTVHQWVEELCKLGPRQSDTLAVLFKSWSDYALANGEKPGTTKWFSQTVAKLGCEAVKNTPGQNGKRGFKGIGVKLIVPPHPQSD
jgi:putative DNA primase/helicase